MDYKEYFRNLFVGLYEATSNVIFFKIPSFNQVCSVVCAKYPELVTKIQGLQGVLASERTDKKFAKKVKNYEEYFIKFFKEKGA